KATGLSNQTLTRLTKQLIDLNIIAETSKVSGLRGQPAIYLRIISGVFGCIGVVFEHDRIVVLVDDLSGENLIRLSQEGTFLTAEIAVKSATAMLDELYTKIPPPLNVLGIGISISGFFTNIEGRICSQQDPQGWSKINWQETFSSRYQCPCYVENDGCAASIGFSLSKAGAKLHSFFLILFTLDIGGGFVFEGELVNGTYGNAGEIAALFSRDLNSARPTEGSLYNHLSKVWDGPVTNEKIVSAFNQQDTNIMSWITACIETMKFPLKSIQSLLDPEAIIFTGRLPIEIQQEFSKKVIVSGPSYGDVFAPTPKILVDYDQNILEKGVTAIPAFYFFKSS
ncbi:MAG: ROK family protein, partial [Paraglaciecola sp.]